MKNASMFNNPLVLGRLSADPSSPDNGAIYYNTTSNTFRIYMGGAWQDVAFGGSAANTALSNLASTAVNASIIPGTDNSIDLGSSAKRWFHAYLEIISGGSGNPSINVNNGFMVDDTAVESLSWRDRLLVDSAGNTTANWQTAKSILPNVDNDKLFGSQTKSWKEMWAKALKITDGGGDYIGSLDSQGGLSLYLTTANDTPTVTGSIFTQSGDGNGGGAATGDVQMGSGVPAASSASGNAVLFTGPASGAGGVSGDILMQIGSISGGATRGHIRFVDGSEGTAGYVWTSVDTAGNGYWAPSASTSVFSDSAFRIQDNGDATKQIAFEASGISTATTRTITMPNANVDLGNLTNSNIAAGAAIAYSKLALSNSIVNADINASAAIAYSKLNLSASIVNADVAAGAAIAYSKLNLSASIVNADIAAGAAIAFSKLAALTSGNILVGNGSNVATSVAMSGEATISNAGAVTLSNAAVIAKVLTGYTSGAGTISATDSILSAIQKLNGNQALYLPLAGGTMSGNIAMGGNKLTGLGAGSTAGDSVRYEQAILVNGANAFTADQSHGSHKITNLADPTLGTDGANKQYVDNLVAGLSWKNYARAASVANVSVSSAPASIDGVTLVSGQDRVLLKDQTTASQNGIYLFNGTGSALTRTTDADTWNELVSSVLLVSEGTVNTGSKWVNTNVAGGTLGTTAVSFVAFSVAGTVNGTGTSGYVAYWSGTSTLTAEQYLSALRGGTGGDSSAATGIAHVTAGVWSYSQIVNADVAAGAAIAYSKLALSNSIVNADINTSAAIAYSKLNLSASIVNADIAAGAAIAYNKLAALTASRVLVSDGSGFVSASTVTSTTLAFLDATSSIQTQLNGKASTALDNLASTAVNVDILPATNNTKNLGSASLNWASAHARELDSDTTLALKANAGSSNLDVTAAKVRRSPDGTNFVEEQYIDATTLTANTTTTPSSFQFSSASYGCIEIDYQMKQATSGDVRSGTIRVQANDTGQTVSIQDAYGETSDIQITPSVSISSSTVSIAFLNGHATRNVTFRADVKRFRA